MPKPDFKPGTEASPPASPARPLSLPQHQPTKDSTCGKSFRINAAAADHWRALNLRRPLEAAHSVCDPASLAFFDRASFCRL